MCDGPVVVRTDLAPAPIGPYSQAVRCDGLLFVSGQIGVDPMSGAMADGGAAAQAEQALTNLSAIIKAAGAEMRDVVKVSIYLQRIADFGEVNEVYSKHFSGWRPARSTLGGLQLPKDALVEIDAVVRIPG